jgi:hypothetical protein
MAPEVYEPESTSRDKESYLPEGDSQEKKESILADDAAIGHSHEIINASGHRDQLDRQYGILSICGMALTVDNAWVAIGTSVNVAICEFTNSCLKNN